MSFSLYLRSTILVSSILFSLFIDAQNASQEEDCSLSVSASYTCTIKVLLDEREHADHLIWKLDSTEGFFLSDPLDPTSLIKSKSNQLEISFKDGHWYLNGHKSKKKQILFKPVQGNLSCDGIEYQGDIIASCDQMKVYLVNRLALEDYVFAVLRTESWPGWPLEVNKVFAIACRTYALGLVMNAKKSGLPYHIKNSNKHQTYKGVHTNELLKDAVKQTEGVFITHNNQPILAMFDCCCGGVIPAHIAGFDFKKAPYLARDYPCDFCKHAKIFRWQAEFEIKQLEELLGVYVPGLNRLREIRIAKKDKAGIAQQLTLKSVRSAHSLPGKKLYSISKEVKSFCYDLRRSGSKVIVTGRGYGHHMGLCQWGARAMVDHGWGYQEIVHFYYPSTKLARLCESQNSHYL